MPLPTTTYAKSSWATIFQYSLTAIAVAAGTLISTSLVWRSLSNDTSSSSSSWIVPRGASNNICQKKTFPVPSWLGWLIYLENPFCPWLHGNRLIRRLILTYRKEEDKENKLKYSGGGDYAKDESDSIALLDVGCGPGRVLEHAARALLLSDNKEEGNNNIVCGCDLSEGMLKQARKKLIRSIFADENVSADVSKQLVFVGPVELGSETFTHQIVSAIESNTGDGSSAKIPPQQNRMFDIITLNCVLGELYPSNRVNALRQLGSLLRKQSGNKQQSGILAITEMVFDPHYIRQKELVELAEKASLVKAGSPWETVGPSWAYTMHFCNAESI